VYVDGSRIDEEDGEGVRRVNPLGREGKNTGEKGLGSR
jgi:hypothetical protein